MTETYACLDFGANADNADPMSPGVFDWATWTINNPGGGAWSVEKGIAFASFTEGGQRAPIIVLHKPYDTTKAVRTGTNDATVLAELERLGFKPVVLASGQLPREGRWVEFADVWLRFESWSREGDASFSYHATLDMRCTATREPVPLFKDGDDMRGYAAWAFAAPRARGLVVTTVGVGGGEGSGGFGTRHTLVDVRGLCGHRLPDTISGRTARSSALERNGAQRARPRSARESSSPPDWARRP